MAGEFNNEPGAITKEQAEALIQGKSPVEIFLWVAKNINTYSENEWELIHNAINSDGNLIDKQRSEIEKKGADKIIADLSKEDPRIVINSRYPIALLRDVMDLQLKEDDSIRLVEYIKELDPLAFYVQSTQTDNVVVDSIKSSITTEQLRAGANSSGPRHLIEAMGYLPLEFTEKELPQLLANSIKNNPNHNFSGISDKFSTDNNARLAVGFKQIIDQGMERVEKQLPKDASIDSFRESIMSIPEVKKVYEMAADYEKTHPETPEPLSLNDQTMLNQDTSARSQADQVYAYMQDIVASQQANAASQAQG